MNNIKQCNCIACKTPRWKTIGFRYETKDGHLYKISTVQIGTETREIKRLLK